MDAGKSPDYSRRTSSGTTRRLSRDMRRKEVGSEKIGEVDKTIAEKTARRQPGRKGAQAARA
jgi:hypothetical protein